MSANKPKAVPNCQPTNAKNNTNFGVSDRKSCESPSPTKPEAKKIPPIKAPVGLARGPDLKNVKSKIGSLDNVKYRPTGGEKKVESQKLTWKAKPRIGSLDNAKHRPLGGDVKVLSQKLEWKAQSKVGSLDNVKHTPGGGQIKIFDEKYIPSPSSTPTPTPTKSGSSTPTPGLNGKENGDTLKTLTGARKSAEKLESKAQQKDSIGSNGSPQVVANESRNSTPISSASSMRTTS